MFFAPIEIAAFSQEGGRWVVSPKLFLDDAPVFHVRTTSAEGTTLSALISGIPALRRELRSSDTVRHTIWMQSIESEDILVRRVVGVESAQDSLILHFDRGRSLTI